MECMTKYIQEPISLTLGDSSLFILMARTLSGLEETKSLILQENQHHRVAIKTIDLYEANADSFRSVIKVYSIKCIK